MLKTSLTSFYKNKVIFLTGSTGVLGMAVAEKLLRTFPDVEKLILLMRPSRKLSVEDRIKTLTSNVALSRVRPEVLSDKISWVTGDLSLDKLGLSEENLKTLVDSVNVVLHCAATVNFEEPIAYALTVNLKGTHEVLKIASQMKNLQSFMYVSSCYSNINQNKIEEKLYPNKFSPQLLLKMLELMDETTLNGMSATILQDWPNTYTFTKNATELLVNEYRDKFSLGIFRPSGIIGSYKEPFPSWIRKDLGPTFVVVGASLGLVRVLSSNPRGNTAFVPVDMTSNALLAAAWDVSRKNTNDVKIYNYSSMENPLTPGDFVKLSLKHIDECKLGKALGYHSKLYVVTNIVFLYAFLKLLWHTIPAYLMDLYAKSTGNKARLVNFYKIYDRRMNIAKPISEFNFIFAHENMNNLWSGMTKEEQCLVYFDVKSINWEACLSSAVFGIKKYFFKETLSASETEIYQRYMNDE